MEFFCKLGAKESFHCADVEEWFRKQCGPCRRYQNGYGPNRYPVPSLLGITVIEDWMVNIYPADKEIDGPAVTYWHGRSVLVEQTNGTWLPLTYGESCDSEPKPEHYRRNDG